MIAILLAFLAAPATPELAPGVLYDARIPTLKQVVGHETGQVISTPEQITTYLEALAKAAPERTRLAKYALTWEGRPLHVLAIASIERRLFLNAVLLGPAY